MLQSRWWTPRADDLVRVNVEGVAYHPIKTLLDEMVSFPYGKHDDTIDAMSRIYDIPVHWPSSNGKIKTATSGKLISPW